MGGLTLLTYILVFAGVIVLVKTVRMVPQGFEWTVERFGKYTHTMSPGLHFLMPVAQTVGRKVNMMEQVLDVPSQDVITKDNAVVKVDGVIFFQVLDAAKAAYEVSNLEQATIALVMTNIRTSIGSLDLDEIAVQARRDQLAPAARGRPGDPSLGHQGQPHRAQGHPAAARPGRFHGPADEGRAREARADPRGRRLARQSEILRAEGEKQRRGAAGRGPQGSGVPRGRGARAPGRGRSQGDPDGVRGDLQRERAGDQLLRRPEVHRGAQGIRRPRRTRSCSCCRWK